MFNNFIVFEDERFYFLMYKMIYTKRERKKALIKEKDRKKNLERYKNI